MQQVERLDAYPSVASVGAAIALLEAQRPDVALLDENLQDLPVTPVAKALQQRRVSFDLASGFSGPIRPIPFSTKRRAW